MNEKDTHTNDNGKKTMVKRRKKVKLGEKGAKKIKLEKKINTIGCKHGSFFAILVLK